MSKVILITGASSGMGLITAEYLAEKGHTVYGAARRVDNMKSLEEKGGHALKLDITNEADIVSVVAEIMKKEGKIDVLWNNAGYGLYGAVEDISIDRARAQFEVNIFGLARMTQEVLPHMRAANSGTIINTSSVGGKIYTPLGAWYHGTKHALEGWSDCLAFELADFNIHVSILEPGVILTEFGDVMLDQLKESSKNSAYGKLNDIMARSAKDSYDKGVGSSPMVIAKTVEKMVNARKPKRRYAVGHLAKPMIFMRRFFGDRIFEAALRSQLS